MALRDYVSGFFHNHNVMAPFSSFYRAMVLKMNRRDYCKHFLSSLLTAVYFALRSCLLLHLLYKMF